MFKTLSILLNIVLISVLVSTSELHPLYKTVNNQTQIIADQSDLINTLLVEKKVLTVRAAEVHSKNVQLNLLLKDCDMTIKLLLETVKRQKQLLDDKSC